MTKHRKQYASVYEQVRANMTPDELIPDYVWLKSHVLNFIDETNERNDKWQRDSLSAKTFARLNRLEEDYTKLKAAFEAHEESGRHVKRRVHDLEHKGEAE